MYGSEGLWVAQGKGRVRDLLPRSVTYRTAAARLESDLWQFGFRQALFESLLASRFAVMALGVGHKAFLAITWLVMLGKQIFSVFFKRPEYLGLFWS